MILARSSNKSLQKGQTECRGAVLRLPFPRGPSVVLAFAATSVENIL